MKISENLRVELFFKAREVIQSRPPDFKVEGPEGTYLNRWHVINRNKWCGLYFHQFLHSDEDRALHDHPYMNMSVVLTSGYDEYLKSKVIRRMPGDIIFRLPSTPHRVALINNQVVTTMFLMGPRIRQWGFHCPRGWVPWQDFVQQIPGGNKSGKGCN